MFVCDNKLKQEKELNGHGGNIIYWFSFINFWGTELVSSEGIAEFYIITDLFHIGKAWVVRIHPLCCPSSDLKDNLMSIEQISFTK